MKIFTIAVVIILAFFGCGDGSGGGSKAPTLSEANAQNGFRAYDVMSMSTYLPSFFGVMYESFSGKAEQLTCNGGGSIDITFENNEVTVPDTGKYVFKRCTLNYESLNVYLNGSLYAVDISNYSGIDTTKYKDVFVLSGGMVKNFQFRMQGGNIDVDLTYNANNLLDVVRGDGVFNGIKADGFFYIQKITFNSDKTYESYPIDTTFTEKSYGKVAFVGRVKKDQGTIGYGAVRLDTQDYELKVAISDSSYLASSITGEDSTVNLPLVGSNNSTVELWEDADETVFARDATGESLSYTTYTLGFVN